MCGGDFSARTMSVVTMCTMLFKLVKSRYFGFSHLHVCERHVNMICMEYVCACVNMELIYSVNEWMNIDKSIHLLNAENFTIEFNVFNICFCSFLNFILVYPPSIPHRFFSHFDPFWHSSHKDFYFWRDLMRREKLQSHTTFFSVL